MLRHGLVFLGTVPRFFLAMSLLMTVLDADPGRAGTIAPELAGKLESLGPVESVSVLFVLESQLDTPALSRALSRQSASRAERHYAVVAELQKTARDGQSEFLETVDQMKARGDLAGYTAYWIANVVVVEASRAAIEALAAHPQVRSAESNFQPSLIEPVATRPANAERRVGAQPGLRAIRADEVWYELGLHGEGTLVACLDTGVARWHPALAARWRGRDVNARAAWLNVVDASSTVPSDVHGHGTHVMGTMVGLDPGTHDTLGVAFGADWIASNAVSPLATDTRFANFVLSSFQWFADPDGDPSTTDDVPDVVQNSWGVTIADGYQRCDTHWWDAIDNCEAAGVVVTFSAGNEGPIGASLRSPADRATSDYQNFAVGAISATGEIWPYPIAGFSSRGPSPCLPIRAIKPEVVAPGVDVFSSWIDPDGYRFASGTSMAGPHVAGVVALMRQANPELSVPEVKRILMETARPYGPEDNTYGHGLVDAYAAVMRALGAAGAGLVRGVVRDPNGDPVAGALVEIESGIGTGPHYSWTTGASGRFRGIAIAGDYAPRVTQPLFESRALDPIELAVGQPLDLDIALRDRSGPLAARLELHDAALTEGDSLSLTVSLADFSEIESATLWLRRDDVSGSEQWRSFPMAPEAAPIEWPAPPLRRARGPEAESNERWSVRFLIERLGDRFSYFVEAKDVLGNVATHPSDGSAGPLMGSFQRLVFADDAEEERGWSLASIGDTPHGHWLRFDPFGSVDSGTPVEPSDDHSETGALCFVTGKGRQGSDPGVGDVDDGCVTLTSPVFDLSQLESAEFTYWRWFAAEGRTVEGASLLVEASADSGATWIELERLTASAARWTEVTFNLEEAIPLSNAVAIRFLACDAGADAFVEAAIDDVLLRGRPRVAQAPDPGPESFATQLVPNPTRAGASLQLVLPAPAEVTLEVFDPSGRRVRRMSRGFGAGSAVLEWDGRDSRADLVPPGVYPYRVQFDGVTRRGKILVLR